MKSRVIGIGLSLVCAGAAMLLTAPVATAAALDLQTRAAAQEKNVRVTGTVQDEQNAIALPGVAVEVVGQENVAYTDVDGRYLLDLPPGSYELTISMDGYAARTVKVDLVRGQPQTVDVSLAMNRFAETITVTSELIEARTSTAAAQLIERKNSQVIEDNMGAVEMKANGDSDAAAALSRVTGLSVVDNQFIYVRGLGERYSNTTLSGSTIPTTEPDKKVVPLDLFPAGLIDSVQIAKSYLPDRSAEFAGGLVQIEPLKLPNRPVVELSYGINYYSTATGKSIPLSPLGNRDWLGFDDGARTLPAGIPSNKIVRRGIFTPDVGYSAAEIAEFGRLFENRWTPVKEDGKPGQNWSVVLGNRFGKLGVIASASHSYKEQYVEEVRRFFRLAAGTELEAISDYNIQTGTQKAQLGIVGNVAYQFSPNHRLALENFYTHSGRDEGRTFEGLNTENLRVYRNSRLQFIEEGLLANGVRGEHFVQGWSNSRIDWRASYARATRDEPDLREVLYESTPLPPLPPDFVLADESQSGFRMFSELEDDTADFAVNWSVFGAPGGRPAQFKFGATYIDRTRDFASRRFRFIPIITHSGGSIGIDIHPPPEELYVPANIGTRFRFNEETLPRDSYSGDQSTTAGYGMLDMVLSNNTRLVGGVRVERFDQRVTTFDPFGLFERTIESRIENTDVFPGVNLVQTLRQDMNLRIGYSTTVNRPEFRELAPFEFTDVVGSRAVRGNPDLQRALIQNVDARWERFTGGRGVLAASVFYKYFDKPIERIVIASAQPIASFQNADHARNFGFEAEFGRDMVKGLFVSANYTYVDSKIELAPEQRTVQTSLSRPLAGQSKNLLNLMAEATVGSFSARALYNFFDDRISDVGANEAPDTIEEARGTLDVVFSQRFKRVNLRLTVENLTDSEYLFTQGSEDQRVFKLGRTVAFSLGYNVF